MSFSVIIIRFYNAIKKWQCGSGGGGDRLVYKTTKICCKFVHVFNSSGFFGRAESSKGVG